MTIQTVDSLLHVKVHVFKDAFKSCPNVCKFFLTCTLHPSCVLNDLRPINFINGRVYSCILDLPFKLNYQRLHLLDVPLCLYMSLTCYPFSSFHKLHSILGFRVGKRLDCSTSLSKSFVLFYQHPSLFF